MPGSLEDRLISQQQEIAQPQALPLPWCIVIILSAILLFAFGVIVFQSRVDSNKGGPDVSGFISDDQVVKWLSVGSTALPPREVPPNPNHVATDYKTKENRNDSSIRKNKFNNLMNDVNFTPLHALVVHEL